MQRIMAVLIGTLIFFPTTSFAQTRKRTTTKSSRAATTPKASEIQREGAARVAGQIKNMTQFIYVLGGVAKGLEGVDDAVPWGHAGDGCGREGTRPPGQRVEGVD